MKIKKINRFLLGENSKLNIILNPFNKDVINFLHDFSKTLNNDIKKKYYPDVKALSFFCRKQHILSLKKKHYNENTIRFGIGLLFHITPSNIPTNFAYSLIFGLLTGNSNIVKVPQKKFEEIDIICKAMNNTLIKKQYSKIRNMISVVRYDSNNEELTKKYSQLCDGRLIWGGDETINNIKKFPIKSKSLDIPFADRYSISLINSDNFLKLKKKEIFDLVKNFYNDTYSVDQNACSSPHVLLWKGNSNFKASKKFWKYLNEFVKEKYDSPLISSVDNFSRLVSDLIKNKNIHSYKKFSKSLYVIKLKKLYPNIFIEKSKWGFFYECYIDNFKEIGFITNRKLQTLTYFGFPTQSIKQFIEKKRFRGIDRVVPIGQALNINLIWDGYDLTKILSREVEII